MLPNTHLSWPHLLAVLEGLVAPLAPSHPGHPEMEREDHTQAFSRGSLPVSDPRLCSVRVPSMLAVTSMEILYSTSQTSKLRPRLGRPQTGWAGLGRCSGH